jgi:ribosomal protein S2
VVDDNAGTELGFQRELKNQHIREYVYSEGDDNTYFLDYADILVYNNSGALKHGELE